MVFGVKEANNKDSSFSKKDYIEEYHEHCILNQIWFTFEIEIITIFEYFQ